MYPVSEAYKTAIRARTRTDRVTGTLTLTDGTVLPLTAAELMSGSLTLDNQCVTGEELAFGCAYLGQAALNLRTALSRHAFYGARLCLAYGLQLPDGQWEEVPLGSYTVAEAERRALYVSIKAYDNLLALQRRYDGTVLQGTAYELLGQIADACGLTLGQTAEEVAALNENAALVCQIGPADGLKSWRDCASAVAQLVGGFAAADRAGRLVIRPFAAAACAALGPGDRSEAGISDLRCHYAALSIETADGRYAAGNEQDSGLTMTITEMPLAEKGLPEIRAQIAEHLFAVLQKLDYTPATVTMPGDPAFEPGDRIALPRADGSAPEMLVTHFVWRYRGRQTLKSVGRNPYLAGAGDGATERTLRRLQNSAESKRLTYYSFTNAAALTVRTAEVPAVTISFAAIEDTSAIFLAQLTADAEPDDAALTLTVHYYLNDQQIENFAPQQRMEAGPHTLALFYPFANVEANTVKRLSVRLVCSGGTVRVAQYGIKATVTGQGMAGETPWNGLLECEELVAPVRLTPRTLALGPLQDGGAEITKEEPK